MDAEALSIMRPGHPAQTGSQFLPQLADGSQPPDGETQAGDMSQFWSFNFQVWSFNFQLSTFNFQLWRFKLLSTLILTFEILNLESFKVSSSFNLKFWILKSFFSLIDDFWTHFSAKFRISFNPNPFLQPRLAPSNVITYEGQQYFTYGHPPDAIIIPFSNVDRKHWNQSHLLALNTGKAARLRLFHTYVKKAHGVKYVQVFQRTAKGGKACYYGYEFDRVAVRHEKNKRRVSWAENIKRY